MADLQNSNEDPTKTQEISSESPQGEERRNWLEKLARSIEWIHSRFQESKWPERLLKLKHYLKIPSTDGITSSININRRMLNPLAVAEFGTRLFKRQGSGFYGKLITLILCLYFLSNVTALLVDSKIPTPPPARPQGFGDSSYHSGKSEDDYNIIFARNLFNSQGIIPGEEGSPAAPDLNAPPVRTSLPFNLVGTMILKDEFRSIATIEDKSASMVYPVRIQDEIPNKAKILSIDARRVVFINTSSGRKEYVELPQDQETAPRLSFRSRSAPGGGTVEQVAPTQYNVSRAEVDKTMSNLNEVLTQARCVPNIENGVSSGYKCFQIVPGSIYEKLGIHNGDIICGINGQGMSDPTKLFEMLGELKTANHVEICIKRDGKQANYAYDIR